jgi:gluconate kinase
LRDEKGKQNIIEGIPRKDNTRHEWEDNIEENLRKHGISIGVELIGLCCSVKCG